MKTHHGVQPILTRRRGAVVLLSAAMLVMLFAFTAFSVDVGYITVTRAKLQAACDAGSMAAALELPDGLGVEPIHTDVETKAACGEAARVVVGKHRAGEVDNVHLEKTRDVEYGQIVWDTALNDWKTTWGAKPYNLVKTTVRRDQNPADPDGPLKLFFAPVIGHTETNLVVDSQAAVLPAYGFRVESGSTLTVSIIPLTLDYDTWVDYRHALKGEYHSGSYGDNYSYNPDTGAVTAGSDGIPEVSLYPEGNKVLPPGNRGTVDFGHSGNSTQDIKRQILYGLNESDMSSFPDGKITASFANPLILNGDTGISAGMKAELEQIKGLPRTIPIFSTVSGNGNNADYTIVKFVGIRIMNVKLNGNPKSVLIQPASVMDPTAVKDKTGTATIEDGVFTRPIFIE